MGISNVHVCSLVGYNTSWVAGRGLPSYHLLTLQHLIVVDDDNSTKKIMVSFKVNFLNKVHHKNTTQPSQSVSPAFELNWTHTHTHTHTHTNPSISVYCIYIYLFAAVILSLFSFLSIWLYKRRLNITVNNNNEKLQVHLASECA